MTISPAQILVIEDDPAIRRFLRSSLTTQNYKLVEAATGAEGLALAASHAPDVILLDLGLPDTDGLEVIARLREWNSTPIIVISARGQERDKVAALDGGADDYLTKPFGVPELLARIRVAIRHQRSPEGQSPSLVARLGDVKIDLARREVIKNDRSLHLAPTEFKLLESLLRHRGRVITHRQLMQEVWGPSHVGHTHYLRIYILQLRRKLEDDPTRPKWILSEPGVGYRIRDEADSAEAGE